MIFGLDVPPVSHLVQWPNILFKGQWYAVNKIAILAMLSTVLTLLLFAVASKKHLVPKGAQNIVESSLEFVENEIIMPGIGPDGTRWMPFLLSMFFFILFCNLFSTIPFIQMPASARMAIPFLLSIMVWVIFIFVGLFKQGPLHYLKNSLFPPGVPKALYIIVTPIEFISTFLVRPFSLAVRLFANTLAGHILLVTFGAFCVAFAEANLVVVKGFAVLPLAFLVFLMAFELLVAFLQAYIFTILTAVYIGGALHPEH